MADIADDLLASVFDQASVRTLPELAHHERVELLALLKERDRLLRSTRLERYAPYAKQRDFHAAGLLARERLFMAGNQLGKTWAGAFEVAMHLTGRYPDWWRGRRFKWATKGMAGSESAELTRKGIQRLLLGPPELREEWGTGALPRDSIADVAMKQGVADAVSSITVRHVSGEMSVLHLNSYDQGRSKWQAETLDFVWFDEEPDMALYSEGLTRTQATGGMVFLTFTPLLGMSTVVKRFLKDRPAGTVVTRMTIQDAEHYTQAERDAVIAAYPEHEREARANGVPMAGSGRVFMVAEAAIRIEQFPIPTHWPRLVCVDFGIDHPAAIVWLAWDRDADTVYVYDTWRLRGQSVVQQAAVITSRPDGRWIPVAWPHDGVQRDKGSGQQLAVQMREAGAPMRPMRAQFEDKSIGFEAGITLMTDRLNTRRLRVFKHLEEWFEEYRMYHREDGQVDKRDDDLMSATRIGLMDLRHAKTIFEVDSARAASLEQSGSLYTRQRSFGVLDSSTGY